MLFSGLSISFGHLCGRRNHLRTSRSLCCVLCMCMRGRKCECVVKCVVQSRIGESPSSRRGLTIPTPFLVMPYLHVQACVKHVNTRQRSACYPSCSLLTRFPPILNTAQEAWEPRRAAAATVEVEEAGEAAKEVDHSPFSQRWTLQLSTSRTRAFERPSRAVVDEWRTR